MHALHKFLLFHVLTCFGGNGKITTSYSWVKKKKTLRHLNVLLFLALRSEIIKGKKTKEKSMLYMASVQNRGGHICGGFLVSEDFVVTAAHCDQWWVELKFKQSLIYLNITKRILPIIIHAGILQVLFLAPTIWRRLIMKEWDTLWRGANTHLIRILHMGMTSCSSK